jgi:hypothetical protein
MTGLSETEHVVEGLACGGVDYVTKPIVLDELLARIRVHLGNARLAYETRAALDASGRFLLATDRRPRAVVHAQGAATAGDFAGTPAVTATLPLDGHRAAAAHAPRRHKAPARCRWTIGGRRLECSFLSPLGPDELLFRLAETGQYRRDQTTAATRVRVDLA